MIERFNCSRLDVLEKDTGVTLQWVSLIYIVAKFLLHRGRNLWIQRSVAFQLYHLRSMPFFLTNSPPSLLRTILLLLLCIRGQSTRTHSCLYCCMSHTVL